MVLFYLFIQYYAVLNTLYSTNEAAYVKIGFLNLVYLYHYHIPTCLEHVSVVQYMFWTGIQTWIVDVLHVHLICSETVSAMFRLLFELVVTAALFRILTVLAM